MIQRITIFIFAILFAGIASAKSIDVKINLVTKTGQGASVGSVQLTDTRKGMLITPKLHGLTPGIHGFHVHVNPSCADTGMAAGGHLDPKHTDKHLGPYKDGHLGDLPALTVDQNGNATKPLLAPRIKVKEVMNHSLMIHAGGDNYSDQPQKLGGGGARVACGVIK